MKTNRYTIYVGLNDGDTYEQKYETRRFEEVLYFVCKNYKASFSIAHLSGGYFHENGQFVAENSMQITLIGGSEKMVNEISEDICTFFNQESVLVIHDEVDSYLVKNAIKE